MRIFCHLFLIFKIDNFHYFFWKFLIASTKQSNILVRKFGLLQNLKMSCNLGSSQRGFFEIFFSKILPEK
jgi:hypothetical protein